MASGFDQTHCELVYRSFEFQKRSEDFFGTHDETLPVAMRITIEDALSDAALVLECVLEVLRLRFPLATWSKHASIRAIRRRSMTKIDIASSDQHFEQILTLQRRYHTRHLSLEAQAQEGFVFAQHSVSLLRRMAAELPQAVALVDNSVVGYCLSLGNELPSLKPMFDQFRRCLYRGRPLSELRFFVGGQVCVDRAHRGHGLLARLYDHVRKSVHPEFDLCVTEIATRNQISVRAHEKMGFEAISTYSDDREEWVIVAWHLSRPAIMA
jgi:GNAT superfamily N-acetyltransferase